MADRELSQIRELLREAYAAGLYQKAARIARHCAELATERGEHFWRVQFRFWQGASLQSAGENEAATTALMEAAQPEPQADPADTYNAITTLIHIAIATKPAAFTRDLIRQGRAFLERSGKGAWRHKLDLLEGHLAEQRGDWDAALAHQRRGYEAERQHPGYPGYTTATHLRHLVDSSFAGRDAEALARWRRALDDCDKETEGDHLYAERARLRCHRAGLPDLGDPVTAASGLLRQLDGYEGGDVVEFAIDALRVLLPRAAAPAAEPQPAAVQHPRPDPSRPPATGPDPGPTAGEHPLIADWLPRPGIGDDWLFGGDVHLARARVALGLPPRDEDWCTRFERPDPTRLTDPQRRRAQAHLAAARAHYEAQLDWAAAEDRRLETSYRTDTLQARLQRTADLAPQQPSP